MANPTDIENFSFQLVYDYWDTTADPNGVEGVWVTAAFVTGVGQAGLDAALGGFDAINNWATANPSQARNVKLQYASVVVWSDWEVNA